MLPRDTRLFFFVFSCSLIALVVTMGDRLPCQICQTTYKTPATLRQHIKIQHPNSLLNNNVIVQPVLETDITSGNLTFFSTIEDLDQSSDSIRFDYCNESILNYEGTFKDRVTKKFQNNLNFVVGLLNIRSLLYKFEDIKFILENGLVDVLIVQETHLDDSRDDSFFIHQKYYMFRRDRRNRDNNEKSDTP